ncbi:MAG: hypothetical protein WC563_15360 [Brevundimonas sp.]
MAQLIPGNECRRVYSYLRLDRAPHKCDDGFGIGVLAPGWDPMSSGVGVQSGDAFLPTMIPGCVLWCETDTSRHLVGGVSTAVVFPAVTTGDDDMEAAGAGAWPSAVGGATSTKVGSPHSGTQCLRGTAGAAGVSEPYHANTSPAVGNWIRVTGWMRGDGLQGSINAICGGAGDVLPLGTFANTWQYFDVAGETKADRSFYLYGHGLVPNTGYFELDDLHFYSLNTSQLTDLTGLGHHLVQATAAKQQLAVVSGSGYVVRGDGLARYFAANYAGNQPRTRYLLAKTTVQASARVMLDGLAADSGALKHKAGSTTTQANAGSAFDGPAITDATWTIYRLTLNGAASSIAINGGAPTVGDAGAGNPAGLTLGAAGGGASGWSVQDSAMVADYTGAHDLATAARIERYMRRLAARLSVPVL